MAATLPPSFLRSATRLFRRRAEDEPGPYTKVDPDNLAQAAAVTGDLGHYRLVAVLGQGSFGIVVRAVDTRPNPPGGGSAEVAIKLLPRGSFVRSYKTYVKREILHQALLNKHPFIITLREVFLTRNFLALAMEYAPGGDLFRYVIGHEPHKRLAETQARWIFQQLIIGLEYIHKRHIANRDLKLENLLLTYSDQTANRPLLKICDFGCSKHELNSSAKTGVGTPIYMAPEIILGGHGDRRYDPKLADIWSCGVILYTMLTGHYPFDAAEKKAAKSASYTDFRLPAGVAVSRECQDLLSRVLVVHPRRRLTLAQITQHPWFNVDLPEGALTMNKFYLEQHLDLTQQEAQVDLLVETALQTGRSGQDRLSVQLTADGQEFQY